MGRERPAEDLCGDVGIGGAPRMGEQAGVKGLRRRDAVEPEAVSEPGRDQRAVKTELERKAHPEVRR